MATNEDLMHAIQALDAKLDLHVVDEKPVLDAAKALIAAHGTDEMIRSRISFVHAWMEREADRKALRRKILESMVLWAVIFALGFIALAISTEIREIVKDWHNSGFLKPPK